jgi:hypothetical protein
MSPLGRDSFLCLYMEIRYLFFQTLTIVVASV